MMFVWCPIMWICVLKALFIQLDGSSVPGRTPSRFSPPWNSNPQIPAWGQAFPFTLQWAGQDCDKANLLPDHLAWLTRVCGWSWTSWEPPGSHPWPCLDSRDTQGVCSASSGTDRQTSKPQPYPADQLQNRDSSSIQAVQLGKGMLPLKFPWDWLKMQPSSRNLHIFIYLFARGSTARGGTKHGLCKSHRAAEPWQGW